MHLWISCIPTPGFIRPGCQRGQGVLSVSDTTRMLFGRSYDHRLALQLNATHYQGYPFSPRTKNESVVVSIQLGCHSVGNKHFCAFDAGSSASAAGIDRLRKWNYQHWCDAYSENEIAPCDKHLTLGMTINRTHCDCHVTVAMAGGEHLLGYGHTLWGMTD